MKNNTLPTLSIEKYSVLNERSWETSAEVLERGNETSQAAQNDNF